MMTDQRDTKPDKNRLDKLEERIEEARDRQEQEREAHKDDRFAFSTPEAYEAEQLEHVEEQHREEDEPDPMEQPTTTRAGTAAHGAFESEGDDKSETEEAADRATRDRD